MFIYIHPGCVWKRGIPSLPHKQNGHVSNGAGSRQHANVQHESRDVYGRRGRGEGAAAQRWFRGAGDDGSISNPKINHWYEISYDSSATISNDHDDHDEYDWWIILHEQQKVRIVEVFGELTQQDQHQDQLSTSFTALPSVTSHVIRQDDRVAESPSPGCGIDFLLKDVATCPDSMDLQPSVDVQKRIQKYIYV